MSRSISKRSIKLGLFCCAFAVIVGAGRDARADDLGAVIAFVVGTPVGHLTQATGYGSIIYYAAESDKPMPIPWTVANFGTSVLGGSVGVLTMYAAFAGNVSPKWSAITGLAGASILAGSAVVVTASLMQSARPSEKKSARREHDIARSLVVLPTGGLSPKGGSTAGIALAGRF
jgi:hypothetical protein